MIDMARYLIGEFQEVSGRLATFITQRKDSRTGAMIPVEVDDFACFHACLANGVPAVFQTTRNALGSGNQHEAFIYGDLGTIHVSSENSESITWIRYDTGQATTIRERLSVPTHNGVDQWDVFMKVLRGGRSDIISTVMDGYINQKVMDAIVVSGQEKRTVRL